MEKNYVLKLQHITRKDIALVGGKAASLGEMLQNNLPIPDGFVLTTKAYKEFHDKQISEESKNEIFTAFRSLHTDRVAVRSSAIAEDSFTASWAGQLNSYLNIEKKELIHAIRKCWNSIDSKRAKTYALHHDIPESRNAVAVVIQKMIYAETAGVMFTANPVNNNGTELMIEACFGPGELLVQGKITPDNYVLDKKMFLIKNKTMGTQDKMLVYQNGKNRQVSIYRKLQNTYVLNDICIKNLAKLGMQIETYFHSYQDIEWVIEKGKVSIVQSRPVTTIGTHNKYQEILRQIPPKPKGVTYALTVAQSVLFADLSLQGNKREYFKQAMNIEYEPQYILIDAGGEMSWNYRTDKQFIKAFGNQLSLIRVIETFIATMEITGINLDALSQKLSSSFHKKLSTENLIKDLSVFWEVYKLHNTSLFTFWNIEYVLSQNLTIMLKAAKREEEINNGLVRFYTPHKLNYFIIERLELEKIFAHYFKSYRNKPLSLTTLSPAFRNALIEHRIRYGFILAPFNLGRLPTLYSLIKRIHELDSTDRKVTVLPQKDTFSDLPPTIKELGKLARQLAFWKTHRLDLFSLADSRMQNHYKLAAQKLFLPLEMLFFMTSDEIIQSLKYKRAAVTNLTLQERKSAYCLLLYNGRVNFYTPSNKGYQTSSFANAMVIKGITASRGKVVGNVKLIMSEKDLKNLKKGDILVTKMTRPEYGSALDRASAFITDEGGLMSHAAIIAREMNKPCIVGTRNATQFLKNGDLIQVDADTGIIEILK